MRTDGAGALVDQSAVRLRALIGRKAISPLELFDACLARIEAVNPMVNAMVALDLERGRTAAQHAETAVMRGGPCGPLHGLPVAIKDLSATAGLRTTWGSLVYKDHIPETDDLIVARIRAAGGIVIGKTNTPEFGAGANTINRVYGATVNPFDTTLSCAGSSGGSAVALATDMVPLASGSDMGGSLRTPASFCGVVGHRPSPGLVPSRSRSHGWSALSVDGAMARTVADLSLLLGAVSGFDNHDPLAQAMPAERPWQLVKIDLARLRVGFSEDLGIAPVSKQVRAAFRQAMERMAPLFASVEWRDPALGAAHTTFETLRGVNFIDKYSDYVERHRELAGPNVIANVESARRITVSQVGRAMAAQTDMYRRFQALFEDIDLLICPAAATTPFPVEEVAVREIDGEQMPTYVTWLAITYAITLTTHPATIVPCGRGPTGMPFGLQIVGRNRSDGDTLAAAAAIEAALADDDAFNRPRPAIDTLVAGRGTTNAGVVPAALEAIH